MEITTNPMDGIIASRYEFKFNPIRVTIKVGIVSDIPKKLEDLLQEKGLVTHLENGNGWEQIRQEAIRVFETFAEEYDFFHR